MAQCLKLFRDQGGFLSRDLGVVWSRDQGVYGRGPRTQQPVSSQVSCAILMSPESFLLPLRTLATPGMDLTHRCAPVRAPRVRLGTQAAPGPLSSGGRQSHLLLL